MVGLLEHPLCLARKMSAPQRRRTCTCTAGLVCPVKSQFSRRGGFPTLRGSLTTTEAVQSARIRRLNQMGCAMQTDCPLVIIRWQDSAQPISAWKHISDLPRTGPIECATVGWLLKDNDEVKVICQSVGDLHNPHNAQASGIMTIPARCVLSIERLSEEQKATAASGIVSGETGSAESGDQDRDSARMQQESESLVA